MIDAIKARLAADWRLVWRHAWSVRLIGAALFFQGVEAAVPYLQPVLPVPAGWFAVLAFAATVAAGIARFIAQKQFDKPVKKPAEKSKPVRKPRKAKR